MKHAFISDKIYAFTRIDKNEHLLVVFNPTSQRQSVPLTNEDASALPHAARLKRIFPSAGPGVPFAEGRGQLTVAAQSLEVFNIEN